MDRLTAIRDGFAGGTLNTVSGLWTDVGLRYGGDQLSATQSSSEPAINQSIACTNAQSTTRAG